MSDSIVFYLDRANVTHVIDPDSVPHHDAIHPLMDIAIAVINAGYSGVILDESRLSNGRFLQCLNVDHGTPEGRVIAAVGALSDSGYGLLSADAVLVLIKREYARGGGRS